MILYDVSDATGSAGPALFWVPQFAYVAIELVELIVLRQIEIPGRT